MSMQMNVIWTNEVTAIEGLMEDEVERAVRIARIARVRTSRLQRHSCEAVDESGLSQDIDRLFILEHAAERIRIEVARKYEPCHASSIRSLHLLRQRPEMLHRQLALQTVGLAYLGRGGTVVALQVHAIAGAEPVVSAVEQRVREAARRQHLVRATPV